MPSLLRRLLIATGLTLAFCASANAQPRSRSGPPVSTPKRYHAPGRWYRLRLSVATTDTAHIMVKFSNQLTRTLDITTHSAWEAQSNHAVIVRRDRRGLVLFAAGANGDITTATMNQHDTTGPLYCGWAGPYTNDATWNTALRAGAPIILLFGTSSYGRFEFTGVSARSTPPTGEQRYSGWPCGPPASTQEDECPWGLALALAASFPYPGCFNSGDSSQLPPRDINKLRITMTRQQFGYSFEWARHLPLNVPTTTEPLQPPEAGTDTYSRTLDISYHLSFVVCPRQGRNVKAC